MGGSKITSSGSRISGLGKRSWTSLSIQEIRSNRRRDVCQDLDSSSARVYSPSPSVGFCISTSCDELGVAVKTMNAISEVIALFVPDSLALGVGTSVFFGVYSGATTLTLFKTQAGNSSLLVFSLLLAYAAAVAFNVVSSFASPPATTVSSATPCRPRSGRPSVAALEVRRYRASHSQRTPAAKDAGPRFSG